MNAINILKSKRVRKAHSDLLTELKSLGRKWNRFCYQKYEKKAQSNAKTEDLIWHHWFNIQMMV